MPGYLLDTDIVSYALRGHRSIVIRILRERSEDVYISSIGLAELRYGAHRANSTKTRKLIDKLLNR